MTDANGLTIRVLNDVPEIFEAARVLRTVWGDDRGPVPTNLMLALARTGNYVVGLFEGERMVGVSVAFFAEPAARSLHSHVTGVLPGMRDRGVGRLLKNHQRAWALQRDVGRITWTFDPLVARNAHFNLAVLGARVVAYGTDYYGHLDDGINRGEASDRLLIEWALAEPPAPTPEPDAIVRTVEVPADIQAMRAAGDPDAERWRVRVRDALTAALDDGLVIGGFDPARGYLLVAG